MLKKYILVILFLCLVPFAIQGIFSIIDDVSAPLAISSLSDPQKPVQNNPGVYLVTYADGPEVFFRNQQTLAYSALNRGIDFIFNYHRSHLDTAFVEKYAKILEQKRGAGYWLWKPWIILKTLEEVPENAIVFYVDSGLFFRHHLQPLIELAQKHDMIFTDHDPKEYGYLGGSSKREALIRLNCDTLACRGAPALWAAFMILRNTPTTRAFIKKWLDSCCDEELITDTPSTQPEYPEHRHHRHDQTILSILCYLNPQGQHHISEHEVRDYTIFHHRHPDGTAWSLLPWMQPHKFLLRVQNKIFNTSLMRWLRKVSMDYFLTESERLHK